jgi:hypothetical protein
VKYGASYQYRAGQSIWVSPPSTHSILWLTH